MKVATALCAAIGGIGMFAAPFVAANAAPVGLKIAENHPRMSSSAKMLGAVDPASTVEVTIWLKPHDKADMDSVAKDLYDPASPNFRHFLKKADFMKRYAPTAKEAKTVANFFTSNKMSVVKMGPDNFYVRARGSAAEIATAFHVTLNNYEVEGKTVRANAEDPYVEGEAAGLVHAIAGLDSLGFTHPMVSKMSGVKAPKSASGNAAAGLALAKATPETSSTAGTSTAFNPACFAPRATQTFTSSGNALPKATYSGDLYTQSAAGCGYTPEDIWKAYNLNALYAEGFNGKGQTIVILDWCGSPTILSDANAFSAQFGLPKLTSENFQITYTPTPSSCESPDAEINLDVEWAHAIAPGAAINLVVPPSASFQDIDEGLFYAIDYQLGNVISNSYGSEEIYDSTSTLITGDLINEMAAVMGISANYSSGDDGDYTFDYPEFNPASASFPASSPYGTSVGGVSLGLTAKGEINWQLGWGTNENTLAFSGFVEDQPDQSGYFNFGSGGGPSSFYAKPFYQKKLKGSTRQVPDISWLADPFTGAYIAISQPFAIPELQYESIGGTSLACPMFSALWAIANQEAGAPLGQAAPYVYTMPKSTIADIVPFVFTTQVTGVVETASGKTKYTATQLAEPVEKSPVFLSVLWDYPLYQDTGILLTFGTDSGLTVAAGWDNVTGVGVPNPKAFADYFKP